MPNKSFKPTVLPLLRSGRPNVDVPHGTLNSALKQAGLKKE
jgi:predicted RNA binding protein YcfA (HicA-like mRNA interferase family)